MATLEKQALTPQALNELRMSKNARYRLSHELGISFMTIYRWIGANSPKLTQNKAIQIISEETGIPANELLQFEHH